MPAEPEPYKIFNDAFSTKPRPDHFSTFTPFCRLPAEIRTQIWTECIPAHRFIRVGLDNCITEEFPNLYTTKNHLGNTVSGCLYRTRTVQSEEWSPDILTRVCHEASRAFRRVYRVRIPLPVKGGDGSVKPLYISPENDTLWVVCDQNTRPIPVLVAFLHDLVAYDPKGIGVAHLAIGGTTLNDSSRLAELDPDRLPPPARQSITKLLSSSLQTFYPVVSPSMEARCMLSIMSWPRGQFHHNKSVPLFPRTHSYTRLGRDPRSIKADLEHVAVNTDPRRTVFLWNRFKANFGVKRHINIRYILTVMGSKDGVGSRADFDGLLQRTEDKWAEWATLLSQPVWGERMSKEEYESQRATLPQAAGIWSFPQEAFGDIPNVDELKYMDIAEWEPKMVKDLSGFQPELWIFNLP